MGSLGVKDPGPFLCQAFTEACDCRLRIDAHTRPLKQNKQSIPASPQRVCR